MTGNKSTYSDQRLTELEKEYTMDEAMLRLKELAAAANAEFNRRYKKQLTPKTPIK